MFTKDSKPWLSHYITLPKLATEEGNQQVMEGLLYSWKLRPAICECGHMGKVQGLYSDTGGCD